MKSWEEQEEEDRRDRELRKRQRLAAALVGTSVMAFSYLVIRFSGDCASFWKSLNFLMHFPSMFLLLFPPLPWAIHFLARPFHRWIADEVYLMMECANFIFYSGISYLLMRWWSSRGRE